MNNLFTPENMNPIGPPDNMNSNPMELFNRIYPYIVQEKQRDFEHQKQLMQIQHPQHLPQLDNIAKNLASQEQQKPMNVVFHDPGPSEFQKQSLALKERDITGNQAIAAGKLAETTKKDTSTSELNKSKLAETIKNNTAKNTLGQRYATVKEYQLDHPNHQLIKQPDGNYLAFNPVTKEMEDTGIASGISSDVTKADTKGKQDLEKIAATGTENRATAETRGWSIGSIPDPKDPTKQIGVQFNQITGEVKPVKFGDSQSPVISKQPTLTSDKAAKITSQTQSMMEGSQMLLPHVGELRSQAANLEKQGLFGPIMSRIRALAAKVGTTGSPEEVQKGLEDFSQALISDPLLNKDVAVGQFATSLGLMASGAGRVHGGSRGGGSIQMINYMKSLLSDASSADMFNGRLNSLESYLKGYAAGPNGGNNNKLDAALDKIFGGKK